MNSGGPAEQLIDGRFELLERLGGGGMGLVWRARDTMLQREVALKEVRTSADHPFQDEDPVVAHVMRERVLREARALARLHHPNVVTIYHIVDSVELRHPWLVMELVTGGSMADRLDRGPLLPHEAGRVGRGVLGALRAAHAAGIQHRDVKPANVLLRPDGTPVLTDFGIAALRESANLTNLTATGALIGSPEYIAPERIRGQEGDPASDLWSLGMLLYVAVEGGNPLRRDTTLATLAAVLDAPIPPPQRSGALTPALAALLVRDPAARPDAARLDQLLADAEYAAGSGSYGYFASGYGPAGGGPSQRPTPAAPSTVTPMARFDQTAVPQYDQSPPRARRRNAVFVSCVAGTALLGLSAALLWTLHGSPASASTARGTGTPSASLPASPSGASPSGGAATNSGGTASGTSSAQSLLTASGMHTIINALQTTTGGTKVVELVVYPNYADVEVPTKADPTVYNDYTYRGGTLTADPAFNGALDGAGTVDLSSIAWSALPTLLKSAETGLNVAQPTTEYIVIDNGSLENAPALRVYESDAFDRGGYLVATPAGHIYKTYPYGS